MRILVCDKCGRQIKADEVSRQCICTVGDYYGPDRGNNYHRSLELCEECANRIQAQLEEIL